MTTYETIKALCVKNDTNPSSVEKALGLSNGIIGSWRKYSPSSKSIQKVADYFSVPVEYLLTGVMPEQSDEAIIASVIKQAYREDTPSRLELIKFIYALDPSECDRCLKVLRALFDK